MEGLDPTEIIACAMRPAGSWLHLLTMVGFVLAARAVGRPSRSKDSVRA